MFAHEIYPDFTNILRSETPFPEYIAACSEQEGDRDLPEGQTKGDIQSIIATSAGAGKSQLRSLKMTKSLYLGLLLLLGSSFAAAAEKTWTGKISDSLCRTSHNSTVEHAGEKLADHDCTIACVKKGGKYVFVSSGKVYDIANQDFAGLQQHAGHTVQVRGEMNGNNIKVSAIAMASKKKEKTS